MNIEKTKRDCLPLAITITYLAISLILLVWLGLTYQLYLILLIVGIALWTAYKRKADLKDESTLYLIALLFSSGFITITNLSFEEIKIWSENLTFDDYFFIKLISNLAGWTFLPLSAAKLATLRDIE